MLSLLTVDAIPHSTLLRSSAIAAARSIWLFLMERRLVLIKAEAPQPTSEVHDSDTASQFWNAVSTARRYSDAP